MRVWFALMLGVVLGCQSSHAPAAGMASLRVKVVAEPKEGVKMPASVLRTYDTPGSSQPKEKGDFERVDYANLDSIVIWLERQTKPQLTEAGAQSIDPGDRIVPSSEYPLDAITKDKVDAALRDADVAVAISKDSFVTPSFSTAFLNGALIFKNDTAKAINLYSVSDGNEFDLGVLAPRATAAYVVKSVGVIEVLTDSVKDPVAMVYATPTRRNKLARSGQTVTFEDLPPGEYRVKSWHPRLPGGETTVKLTAGEVGSATVKVGVNSLPKVAGPR